MTRSALRRRTFGWMMFDWASQPFYTLLLTFVFGPYFAVTAAEAFLAAGMGEEAARARAQTAWSLGQAGAGLVIALSAPLLGALADASGGPVPCVAGLSALRRGAGEQLNARQVEQKKPVLRSTCKLPRNQNEL